MNPPKQITESANGLVDIDYSYLADLAKAEESKQIAEGKKETPIKHNEPKESKNTSQ